MLPVETGQQAERALEQFRCDQAGGQALFDLQADQHHCLGNALARLEGRIAIEELTRRYPALELTATPTRRPLLVLRGFESVPVRATQMPARCAA